MHGQYTIEVGKDSEQIMRFLEDKIYKHNSLAVNKADGAFFSRIIRDENEQIIAGIAGWTWAAACEITQLWVGENARKNGVGKLLLEAAEAEAKSKGCLTIVVKSYSFQAPHFYEKHGFEITHILNDFPPGYHYYVLSKGIG